eukprot:m.117720 g.117720  ORF g.117720 m.117720 type:complete len:81 (+) comp37624_c0_seq12:587-829(+)
MQALEQTLDLSNPFLFRRRLLPKTKHCESRILCRKGRGLRKGEASLKTKTEGRNAPSRLLPACSFHMRSLYVKVFQFKTR